MAKTAITLHDIVPSVSRETEQNLHAYEALVRKWQPHINLVANATLPDLWQRHILDSAQVFALNPMAKYWLDLGSGGGFPGIVTAIFLKAHGGHIDLIESNGKKAAFLRSVIAELDLPAFVHAERIETMAEKITKIDVITARALASLSMLFDFIAPWFEQAQQQNALHHPLALLQKGRDYRKEIAEANPHWTFDLIQHQSKLDEQSVILEIGNLRKKVG